MDRLSGDHNPNADQLSVERLARLCSFLTAHGHASALRVMLRTSLQPCRVALLHFAALAALGNAESQGAPDIAEATDALGAVLCHMQSADLDEDKDLVVLQATLPPTTISQAITHMSAYSILATVNISTLNMRR